MATSCVPPAFHKQLTVLYFFPQVRRRNCVASRYVMVEGVSWQTADAAAGCRIAPRAVCLTDSLYCTVQGVAFVARVPYDAAESVTMATDWHRRRHQLPASVLYVAHWTAAILSYICNKRPTFFAKKVIGALERISNYIATSNDMKLVHWPLTGGLLHLVQRGGDWAEPKPAQAPPRCTKCNSPPINGQCINTVMVRCSAFLTCP